MPSKPAQNVWYELWEEAGSRGLDTWHMLKGTGSVRNSDYPTFPAQFRLRILHAYACASKSTYLYLQHSRNLTV